MFAQEAKAMTAARRNMHLIDTEALTSGPSRIRPPLGPSTRVVYRGWMLTHSEYVNLAASVERAGGSCFTSPERYVARTVLSASSRSAMDKSPTWWGGLLSGSLTSGGMRTSYVPLEISIVCTRSDGPEQKC